MCKICNRILQVNNLAKSKLQYDVNLITLFGLWLLLFLFLLLLFFYERVGTDKVEGMQKLTLF